MTVALDRPESPAAPAGAGHGHSANREAAAHFEQALEALERLPESRARSERGIDVRLQLRGALTALAEYRRLFDHLRRAQALAENLGDQQRLVRVSSYVSQRLKWVGDLEQARKVGPAERRDGRSLGRPGASGYGDHVPGRDPQCARGIPAGD